MSLPLLGSPTRLPGESPASRTYAALPPSASRGVVVLHEVFGPQPEIERVVERFARAGYAAVAPDLTSGGSAIACLARAIVAIQRGEGAQLDQIRGARAWLCEQAGIAEGRVGLIGFCLGGGFALAAGHGWGAVSTNYGYIPPTRRLAGLGPTIGCYGGRDRFFGSAGAVLKRRLDLAGIEVEAHTFPTVGHGFLTDGDYTTAAALTPGLLYTPYDPAVAEEGWQRILAFLGRHLGDEVTLAGGAQMPSA